MTSAFSLTFPVTFRAICPADLKGKSFLAHTRLELPKMRLVAYLDNGSSDLNILYMHFNIGDLQLLDIKMKMVGYYFQ